MTHSPRHFQFGWHVLALLSCFASTTLAQPLDPSAPPVQPLRFRHVFVPQEELDQFTRGYLPMQRTQLPEFIKTIAHGVKGSRDDAAWIQSADYSAVFVGEQLTHGLARLNVVHTSVDTSILLLSPCQLAMGAATWQGAEEPEAAVVGNDLAGNLIAQVHDSGQLQFPWTLQGTINDWGETSFDIVLAPAPMNRMTVDLPVGYRLFSNCGIVTEIEVTETEAGAALSPDSSGITTDMRRWIVQLGGTHRFQLTVAANDALRQRRQQVNVEQDTRYRLADDGLDFECNVALDVGREPLEVLLFRVDPELQITSVRLENRDAPWSLTSESEGRSRQLEVRFTEPLARGHRTLQLSAIGSLRTDNMWRLPTVRPENTFWRQGTMSLWLPRSLGLRHLATYHACHTAPGDLEPGSPTATRHFELFSPDGYLEVGIARTLHQMSGIVGTTIDREPGTLTAHVVTNFSCVAGQHYLLEADLPNAWMLDGIEAEPADALEDHQFVVYDTQHKRLQIRLARPLTAEQPLRLSIRVHRTPSLVLRAEDFRPVLFRNLASVTRLVAIAPAPSFRLDLSGDAEVARLEPASLPPTESDLIEPRSGGIVFRDDQQADTVTIKVTREDPTFTADNHVLAEITRSTLTESYQLVCKPESTSISRLLILLTEPRDQPITWSVKANGNTLLGAAKLNANQGPTTRYNQSGEVWELMLRNPQDTPFEISGSRQMPFSTAQQISLATFPDATSQEGSLAIVSLDGATMSIKASSVKAIPSKVRDPDERSTANARYRYDVSHNAQVLVDHVEPHDAQAPLWAWQCLLCSQLLDDGDLSHQATYLLESAGGSEFQFRLPSGCLLTNVEIDGAHIVRPVNNEQNRSYSVTLPPDKRYLRVTVAYRAPKCDCRLFGRVSASVPEVDIPVLDRQWTIWLAPGWKPAAHSSIAGYGQPATWSQRLLGPFAAQPSEPPFDLFSTEHWSALLHMRSGTAQLNTGTQLFLQLLGEQCQSLTTQSDGNVGATWRGLLTNYQRRAAGAEFAPQVWIESLHLTESGFSLDHTVGEVSSGSSIRIALQLISQAQLAVLSYGDVVVLTCSDNLAHLSGALEPTESAAVWTVRENSRLARDLDIQDTWPRDTLLALPAVLAQPAMAHSPWTGRRATRRRGIAERHWRACEIELGADDQSSLEIVRTSTLQALGWALLLSTASIIFWLGSTKPRLFIPVLVAASVLAMLAPDNWVPLTTGMLLGTVLAGCVYAVGRLVQSTGSTADSTADSHASINITATVGLALLAAMSVFATRSLHADDPPVPTDRPQVFKVIVPVDGDLKPVGDYDYVPTEFYDILHRKARDGNASPQNWLACRGTYRVVFNWTRQRSFLDLTSLTAIYDLELFQPLQRIEFPWNGNDPAVQILEARLAGQPIELRWNDARTAFFVTVANAGITQLELVILPETSDLAGSRTLQVQIPPLSSSQLLIEAPMDAAAIRGVSAVGETGEVTESGEQRIELGPAATLTLQWASGGEAPADSHRLAVQQLSWIKVHPKDYVDSVILDTQFRIDSAGDRLNEISLQFDARLQLIPIPADWGIEIIENSSRDGDANTLVLRLREPAEQTYTLHLLFRMMNTTGLGNLAIPRLEVVGGRVDRHWMAVSVAPDLDFTARSSDAFTPLDAGEFLTVWGEAELAPALCYRMEAEDPLWSFATRSRKDTSEAQQQLDISVGHTLMNLAFTADVNTTQGTAFQHRFEVPKGFRVTDVLATVDGEPIAAEAEHDGSGSMTLFLGNGVSGLHHVRLLGQLAVPALKVPFAVPEMTLRDMTITKSNVRLYRQANVLISVRSEASNTSGQGAAIGQYRPGLGRLLADIDVGSSFVGEDGQYDQPAATLRVQSNQPSVQARLATTLVRADDAWEAIADYEGRVTDPSTGVMDQFRFDIPVEWMEPFTLEPDMPYTIRSVPGHRRHLIVRPPQPISHRFQLRIRGGLVLDVNERGRTPNIVPLDVANCDRFFVLPTQLDQQRIDWETSGLHLVPLRDALPNSRLDARAYVAYTVYARPRAVIADVQRVAGVRQIGLADVHVMCQADGSCFGNVRFQVEPAGLESCTLEVPKECELIQASVESVPATLTPLAERRWHLRLASEQLPLELSIVFRAQLPTSVTSEPQLLHVPWIADMDVVRTLWTVYGSQDIALQGTSAAEQRVSAAEQEAIRFRSTASLVESAVDTVLDSPASEIQTWYTPWAVRLACSTARLNHDRQQLRRGSTSVPEWIRVINQQQELISQRLNVSQTLKDYQRQTTRYPQPNDMLRFAQRSDSVAQHYAFQGLAPAVAIERTSARVPSWWYQVLGAALTAAVGGLIWLGLRSAKLVSALCQWPYAVGVLAGLVWWLCATPSLLGWLIVAVSLWGALRLPMPSQRVRSTGTEPSPSTNA